MKGIILVLVGLLAFGGVMGGTLYVTGAFSKQEKVEGTEGKTEKTETKTASHGASSESGNEATANKEDIWSLSRAMKLREEELNKREAQLKLEEQRIQKRQADLEELQSQITTIQEQIQGSLKQAEAQKGSGDEERKERLQNVASSLSKMKATNAAKMLEEWTPEDAAEILMLTKDKERGKILDAMTPEKSAPILQAMQQPKS